MKRRRAVVSCLLAVGLVAAIVASNASAATVWLCKPGLADSPCTSNLTTATYGAGGARTVEHLRADPNAKADCFYIYPTVSDQPTAQANLDIDPVERSIVLYQADYYSRYCKVYAPIYRQFTLTAANGGMVTGPPANPELATQDVDNAFLDYLHHFNHGRPIIFISHSQGSGQLEALLAKYVDPNPELRKLMLSAVILGGNVTVKNGSQEGGTFQDIPACRSVVQLSCVVAFSSFSDPPTAATFFGRTTNAGQHVLCTNPADLAGGSHVLDSVFPSAPFAAGTIATAIKAEGLPVPPTPTPWVQYTHAYIGACAVTADGDNYLEVTSIPPTLKLNNLSPMFGLHLVDSQIGLGNIVSMVHSQIGVWERKNAPKVGGHHRT